MSQNMLPFEPKEALRFGRFSLMRLKMRLLRATQGRSFRQADGLIFLTRYAQDVVSAALGGLRAQKALISHGVEPRFFCKPRSLRALAECSPEAPFRVLYVSIMMPYKHQIEAVRAVGRLRGQGVPIELSLVGALWGQYGAAVKAECERLDPQHTFLHVLGALPFADLHRRYGEADAFLFPSSCENLPNILLEAMAAGLPIASARSGPMPEVLGDSGVYFDPTSDAEMAAAVLTLAEDVDLRQTLAANAYERAQAYSWARCAEQTFAFIAQVANEAAR
ncbi:glycosyltransferase [Denitromonas iodatirespirans]|nr:glycosyltransferase [Denitromonas iodatirespirans]